MKNSYRFFENKDCEYYPCHKEIEEMNCLFCYCPLYRFDGCPGNPKWIAAGGKSIKSCEGCTFPHRAENYDKIIELICASR